MIRFQHLFKPLKGENKGIINALGLAKCSNCGNREFLVNDLCSNCWYEIYGRGKHIWEIWDMLEHKSSKKNIQIINEIKGENK